ncbi:MAG TPA: 1,4-dihydroxy-2-naphthoate polyprenyltransferase [Thermoanaerobaculia bacterium]|nr:1,4-dihydroxy-2-naphthoate polyprenyltransferase [Thermoanaerobaculia bacterium]
MTPWIAAARPKTLAAAVVPVMIGAALAPRPLQWWLLFFTLAGAVLIQIGTNFVNDALDFEKGADTGERLGPLRVTSAGLLSAEAVMRGAYVCFALAVVCGIPLLLRGGWPLLAIGVASILAAYAYTGGPYPLAYHGLGELFVMLFFGVIAVGGTYYVQALSWPVEAIMGGVASGSLAIVILAINNLRDLPNDAAANKRTLAVRFGERFARAEIVFFAFLPFVCTAIIVFLRRQHGLPLPMLAVIIAAALVRRVSRSRGRELNGCLAMAGGLEWAFGILFVIGSLL